jgi:hypothetical protein
MEGAGYLATLLLALSLMVNNDLRFRWLNSGGCVAFIIYGLLIGAVPVVLTNTLLLGINAYALFKIYRRTEDFDLLEFHPDSNIVAKFLRFYADEIRTYFPAFRLEQPANAVRFMVLRDMAIANVFVAELQGDGSAIVRINYTVARFRDYKVGRFIFEKEYRYLLSKGINKLVYTEVINKEHREYLHRMRFQSEELGGQTCMVKYLNEA